MKINIMELERELRACGIGISRRKIKISKVLEIVRQLNKHWRKKNERTTN